MISYEQKGGIYMSTDAQKKAQRKYAAGNTLQIGLQFNRKTDADIIQVLETVPNKQGYIKQAIRDKMKAGR